MRCVALRPTGRGPGTVYQDYGAVDTFEAIDDVRSRHSIDGDAISVSGFSMGGAATWYLLSHYPDSFAAGAPFCGYADYRLWEKPGGGTFPMRPWEEESWVARSAAFLLANLDRTPIWVVHGEWDRAVGGGVSVEHSRSMVSALEARGARVRYDDSGARTRPRSNGDLGGRHSMAARATSVAGSGPGLARDGDPAPQPLAMGHDRAVATPCHARLE